MSNARAFYRRYDVVVLIRVNKMEESISASLIHMYNTLGPILGANCCIDEGKKDVLRYSYIRYLNRTVKA